MDGFGPHFPEEVWKEYALGERSEKERAALEEHLLVCSACQNLLERADEYIRFARTVIRSHITKISDSDEQELLRRMAEDVVATRTFISRIVAHYRAASAVQDLETSTPDLFIEKVQFWFHITRLRLAWLLRTVHALPAFRYRLVAKSVLSLSALSPHLLEVL